MQMWSSTAGRVKPACESQSDHLVVPLQEGLGRAASLFIRPPFIGHGGGWVLRVHLRAAAVSMRCDIEAESVSGPLSVGRGSCTRCSFVDGIVLGWHIGGGLHKSSCLAGGLSRYY